MKKVLVILMIFFTLAGFGWKKEMPEWARPYYVKYIRSKSQSDAPVRYFYEQVVLSKKEGGVLYQVKKIIKIQNLKGRLAFSTVSIPFNKDDNIIDANIYWIDGTGQVKKLYRKKDMAVLAISENFIDDSKQLAVSFDSLDQGDVIIVDYSFMKKEIFPHYFLSFAEDGDILESEIVIKGAQRVAVLNDKKGVVTKNGDSFKISNVAYIKDRKYMPPRYDLFPIIAASFSEDLNSWETIGKKYWEIASPSLDLPEITKITLSNPSDKKKSIKEILKYVAAKINYVDIEIGAGRIIPKKCSFVYERKYGDCKDKTFFAINLLKNIGVDAYPVLAKGFNDGKVYPEFPGIQFNHVVVAVKLDDETRDLQNLEIEGEPYLIFDVTDRITDPPYLPASLQGTHGLLVTPDGGKLIQFPVFSEKENLVKVSSKCRLDSDFSVSFTIEEEKKGLPAYTEKWFIDGVTEHNETKKYTEFVQDYISGAKLIDYEVENKENFVKTEYTVEAVDYAIKTTDGILIIPFPFTSKFKNPFKKRKRKIDIVYNKKFSITRSAEWAIPGDFKIANLPADVTIDTPYFFFERKIKQKEGKIFAYTRFVRKEMVVPASDYKAFRKAYKKYIRALKSPIVITK